MFVVRDGPVAFHEVAGHVARSTIAVAVGTRLDGRPNIVGTAFCAEIAEHFVTCWHVAALQDRLSELREDELQQRGLTDHALRFGVRAADGRYVWTAAEPGTWFRSASEVLDICVFRVLGVAIPPLILRKDTQIFLGTDVGIIGFPLGNRLQGTEMNPFAIRSVVAGVFDSDADAGRPEPLIAIGTGVAGGFSGAPIFSAADAQILGMVASTVLDADNTMAGISLGSMSVTIWEGLQHTGSEILRAMKRKLTPPAVDTYPKTPHCATAPSR